MCLKNVNQLLVFGLFLHSVSVTASAEITLKPFKDDLFSHTQLLSEEYEGRYQVFDYNEMRDINGRDEVPVTRAAAKYVELLPQSYMREYNLSRNHQGKYYKFEAYEVGADVKDKFAVVFIHGQGGTRELGMQDWMFSGNFNRLKHLVIRNDGAYYTPTVPDFGTSGAYQVEELIKDIASKNPNSKIILACASMGGYICSQLANSVDAVQRLSGMIFMGTFSSVNLATSYLAKMEMPIVFAHGTRDSLCKLAVQKQQFANLLKLNTQYPTIFYAYETGGHGTPIRMFDWKTSLNWIFSSIKK
ncbi:MAG: alpha/beta family hydrolase [Pseudobdellovibrio sp.]